MQALETAVNLQNSEVQTAKSIQLQSEKNQILQVLETTVSLQNSEAQIASNIQLPSEKN